MGQSARAKTQPWKNFKQKTLDVMGPFLRCKKGLEDIKNAPDDTVRKPAEDYIKLTDQTVLLLVQALSSILYSRRLQIYQKINKHEKPY